MQNLIKKTLKLTSVLGVVAILAGCAGMCPNQRRMHNKKQPVKTTQTVEYYQTYSDADVNRVKATMYTRSSHGGESKMGYIKFTETDSGLKMIVDVKDLRPGVTYTPRIYQCNPCASNATTCCSRTMLTADLPRLRIDAPGRLEETYMIRGLMAGQLQNAQIYLERDGGYKAAWGTLDKDLF